MSNLIITKIHPGLSTANITSTNIRTAYWRSFVRLLRRPVTKKILRLTGIGLLTLLYTGIYAQSAQINSYIKKETFTYIVKDADTLKLDIYKNKILPDTGSRPCVIFIFGGGFITGHRDDTIYNAYFNSLAEHGYLTVSVSYRLGMKGAKHLSLFNTAPLKTAIDMAVDDVYDATNWLVANAEKLRIDTSKIILSGSSAGAVTALEADFTRRNNKQLAKKLPEGFQYAAVISFSGAILSYDGKLSYALPPAPTLLFHGTADKIMPYKKMRFFNKGFFGSSSIAGTFKKNKYPYCIFREQDMGHEIAVIPMINQLPLVLDFIDKFVLQHKPLQLDISYKGQDQKPILTISAKELFERLQSRQKN